MLRDSLTTQRHKSVCNVGLQEHVSVQECVWYLHSKVLKKKLLSSEMTEIPFKGTVDPEIFARLYFREIRVSDLFASWNFREHTMGPPPFL